MKYLLDTHLLLWLAQGTASKNVRKLVESATAELHFSAASILEVAIKNNLKRADFQVDPHVFRRGLTDNGYLELPINSAHAAYVVNLDEHHKDPIDRLLIAQATVEGITLLTSDATIARYSSSPISLVK